MYQEQQLLLQDPGRGGINERQAPHLINDNQSARPDSGTLPMLNVHSNELGSIVVRNGYSVYGSTQVVVPGSPNTNLNGPITGLFQYRKFDGSTYEIVCGDKTGSPSTSHVLNVF
jgi:hypothetical protein